MSDIYKNPFESQKIFNELLDALKDKKESLPRTCDQRVRHKLDGLDKLDEYGLLKVKSVEELLIQYLKELLVTSEFKRTHDSEVENMRPRKIYALDTRNLDCKTEEVTESMRELEIYLKKLKDKNEISKKVFSELDSLVGNAVSEYEIQGELKRFKYASQIWKETDMLRINITYPTNEDSENLINILNNNYSVIKVSREYCSKWKDSH